MYGEVHKRKANSPVYEIPDSDGGEEEKGDTSKKVAEAIRYKVATERMASRGSSSGSGSAAAETANARTSALRQQGQGRRQRRPEETKW